MNRQSDFISSLFPFAVIAAVMSLAAFWSPYALDNHLFEAALLERCPEGFSWSGFFDYVDAIRNADNCRLPNILAPVVTLYAPKWIFALVTGCAVAFMTYAAATFGNGTADGMQMHHPQYSFSYMVYAFAAMLLFLPWGNNLLTGDYAMNYIWGGAVAMAMIFSARSGVGRKKGWIVPLLLGAMLGMWHEGIAVATAAGVVVMAVALRFDRRFIPYYIGALSALLFAAVWALNSYLTVRASAELSSAAVFDDTLRFIRYNILAIVFFVSVVYCLLFRRAFVFDFMRSRPLSALFVGCSLAALVLAAFTAFSGRASFWGEMVAIVAFGIILEPFIVRRSHLWTVVAVGMICLVLCTAEVLFCKAFNERYTAFEESLAKSPDGTVYGPVYLPKDFPSWLPQFVPRQLFVEPFTYRALSERYAPKSAALVPVEFGLINFRKDAGGPVVTQEGNIYMSPSAGISEPVVLNSLGGVDKRFFAIPFDSRDGKMICVYPID